MNRFRVIMSSVASFLCLSACVSETSNTTTSQTVDMPMQTINPSEIPTISTTDPIITPTDSDPQDREIANAAVPYQPLIANTATPRQITGVALSPNTPAPLLRTVPVSGSIGANGQDFEMSDTVFTLRDADGQNARNQFSDGTLTMVVDQADYTYSARYAIEDGTDATLGVFGIATTSADMPSSGTASFKGFGEITEVYPSRFPRGAPQIINHIASSDVDVNFASGKVNAALEVQGFTVQPGSEIDRLSARGMQLAGSSFQGGTVKMFENGTRVQPIGTNTDAQASGQFFGAKRTSTGALTPAEVGGVIRSSSAEGLVFGTFIAK